jgi:UDP-N-acetylglucosamine:LPS N-acetylglucosamine transferase
LARGGARQRGVRGWSGKGAQEGISEKEGQHFLTIKIEKSSINKKRKDWNMKGFFMLLAMVVQASLIFNDDHIDVAKVDYEDAGILAR